MGGRGASSGQSVFGNAYGSQYHSLGEYGMVKFVTKNTRDSEPLMETMTPGRIYATVGGDKVIRITFFDSEKKRNKVIELDKRTNTWHVHKGYEHGESSNESHEELTESDKLLLEDILKKWKNRK